MDNDIEVSDADEGKILKISANSEPCDSNCADFTDIPSWLRMSDLYRTTLASGLELSVESFTGSNMCYVRVTTAISNISDFVEVVGCIDYWGVDSWPDSVYAYTFNHVSEVKQWRDGSEFAAAHHDDLSDSLLDVVVNKSIDTLTRLCEFGSIGWLKYIHSLVGYEWKKSACNAATRGGHLSCLQYAHENGCPWNDNTCNYAAQGGRLSCLQYAHENGCPWDKYTCSFAAQGCHLACLEYAHENGCPWNEDACWYAAGSGHLSCLEYLHENGCPWDENTSWKAAQGGYLSCLQYAHENGCVWGEATCSIAAYNGHLNCLQYAHENGCPWNANTYRKASQGGHLACMQYARENGCPE